MNQFEGFILAGGKSSRMGADKAFLEFGGETFLERAVKTLSNLGAVRIVLNKSQTHFIEKLPATIPHIFDIFENRGALGGIHAALRHCKTEFAVILAVDLPFVDANTIEKLTEIALSSDEFSAIVPRQNDARLQPLCAVYRAKNCLSKIEGLLLMNESSNALKDFLNLMPVRLIEQNDLPNGGNLLLNVNNLNDFSRANEINNF